ncbi:MAG: hypothetical protein FK730_11165 [Asgard group archaeon]|nr:hypothetical protein [Asgard group archaeon]
MVHNLNDFTNLLREFDHMMVDLYFSSLDKPKLLEKTNFKNATGHKSRVIDLVIEDAIIDFFHEKDFSCEIEAEERGRTIINETPKYLVVLDPLDGTTNFSKGIPLTCYGIAIAKLKEGSTNACFEDILTASVRSFHTNELFMSNLNKGCYLNGKPIKPSPVKQIDRALVAFDLDRSWNNKETLNKILKIFRKCRGTRRFGANLLDMCYVASGKVEIMIDIRNRLSAVHTPGLFIAKESGAVINSTINDKFNPKLLANEKMGFILCCNEELLEQIKRLLG